MSKETSILLCDTDIKYLSAITRDGRRDATKTEVLRVARYFPEVYSGGGIIDAIRVALRLLRWFITATWKAGQCSVPSHENDTTLPTTDNDTLCRIPQSGHCNSQHSCSSPLNKSWSTIITALNSNNSATQK